MQEDELIERMKIERDAAVQEKNNLLRHMEFLKTSQKQEIEKQLLVRFSGFAPPPVNFKYIVRGGLRLKGILS